MWAMTKLLCSSSFSHLPEDKKAIQQKLSNEERKRLKERKKIHKVLMHTAYHNATAESYSNQISKKNVGNIDHW